MPPLAGGVEQWSEDLRSLEEMGYSGVAISDHVIGGWSMDPIATLAAAAVATNSLRLITLVLSNDYRHPALVHKAIATIDVISRGRAELGLGAGWWREEYAALGIPFESAGTRVDRLEESVAVIKALFGEAAVTHVGDHYRVTELAGLPRTVQRPRIPILIGGGGSRVLRLAGRDADVAGINPVLGQAGGGSDAAWSFDRDRVLARVAAVRDSARSAGRPQGEPRLQISVFGYAMTHSDGHQVAGRTSILPPGVDVIGMVGTPGFLVGSVDECADQVRGWRTRYGFSDIHVGGNAHAFAPLVERLAGK